MASMPSVVMRVVKPIGTTLSGAAANGTIGSQPSGAAMAPGQCSETPSVADKLTRRPNEMDKSDVDRLREVDWTEEEIVEAVLVVSVHACANRFSAGLGLIADF